MNAVNYVSIFMVLAIFVGNIVYDRGMNKAPINWKRMILMAIVVVGLIYFIEWAAEDGLDINSK